MSYSPELPSINRVVLKPTAVSDFLREDPDDTSVIGVMRKLRLQGDGTIRTEVLLGGGIHEDLAQSGGMRSFYVPLEGVSVAGEPDGPGEQGQARGWYYPDSKYGDTSVGLVYGVSSLREADPDHLPTKQQRLAEECVLAAGLAMGYVLRQYHREIGNRQQLHYVIKFGQAALLEIGRNANVFWE